jgi:methionyl-tRNA synthetase
LLVIISTYDPDRLHRSYGIDLGDIDMGAVEALGVGANWGRVAPAGRSDAHQHDETETFVIVQGRGDLVVDSGRRPVWPGMVIQFEPFETHHLENTGEDDLLFATFYWRDAPRAARVAGKRGRRRFDQRPIFVFSSPTTPNGDLHLGHLSGPYLGADVYTRFQRMNGARVWHIAGSDDFQSYVAGTARSEGRTPAETAAHYSAEILATHKLMDIGVDHYTVSDRDAGYVDGVRDFFARVATSPLVSVADGDALFDGESGQYLYEVDVTGSCPTCGSATGGNMCEECGEPNFATDLVDPQATASTATPKHGRIARYSLALRELGPDVAAHHHLGRVPVRVKELTDRLFRRERLDLAISHPSSWGVEPIDSALDGQVIWVWADMAYRFLHGIEAVGREVGEDWRADSPDPDWKIVHFLGFDNSFYHAIFCPALYKLAYPGWTPDIDYNLNEFYLLDDDKFSTSRRHAVWGKDVLNPSTVDSLRFYLSWTRPEGRRTNFAWSRYEAFRDETLIATWQRWLTDLGERVESGYGGMAPDAGVWTPEHAAFLARLDGRLGELTTSLGQDGFSLNQAARALHGIVEDVVAFGRREQPLAGIGEWKDEARTAVALELAAARLLANGAMPVMPRFATRLAACLGASPPATWPNTVTLVAPGTRIELPGQTFFAVDTPPLHEWLVERVAEALQLPVDEVSLGSRLVGLGMTSLQAIAVQYQVLEKTGVDVSIEDLLGERTIAQLAEHLDAAGSATVEVP